MSNNIVEVTDAISEFLDSHRNQEVETNLCSCGAITMTTFESSDSIQFKSENAPFIKPTNDMVLDNCNHCANNWGVDIDEEYEDEEDEEE
jgi:hypothetical protein